MQQALQIPCKDFTSGFTISSNITRLNGNVNGAFGVSGKAGPITVTFSGARITNFSGSLIATATSPFMNVYNNIVYSNGATAGYMAIGGTAAGLINYYGVISNSAACDFYIGNAGGTFATSGGAGYTTFQNTTQHTYTGETVLNATTNGYFQLGTSNCLPAANRFVICQGGNLDLDGTSQSISSIETQTTVGGLITNSNSGTPARLVLNGGNAVAAEAMTEPILSAVIGASNSFSSSAFIGYNNINLWLKDGAGSNKLTSLTLTAHNTFTGGLKISGATDTLIMGVASCLSSSNADTLDGGLLSTGAGYSTSVGFNQSLGTLMVTSNNGTIVLGTTTHTINIANSSAIVWGGTLTISNWTFGTTAIMVGVGGLTGSQLSNINFTGHSAGAQILNTGELAPSRPYCNRSYRCSFGFSRHRFSRFRIIRKYLYHYCYYY